VPLTFLDGRLYSDADSVRSLLAAAFAAHADRHAVIHGTRWLTYGELAARVAPLADALRAAGARPHVLVAILIPRSIDLVAALLATIETGAAFILLEPALPTERLTFILDDCEPSLLLVPGRQDDRQRDLETLGTGRAVLYVDADADADLDSDADADAGAIRHAASAATDLAYVIYTSGSTGAPKGVAVEGRALAHQLRWLRDAFPLTPRDRVLFKSSPMFDVVLWESLGTLACGAQLVLADAGLEHDIDALVRLCAAEDITVIDVTPSMLGAMVRHPAFASCRQLRRVTCGGEKLTRERVEAFHAYADADLFNMYGPAEATITATAERCPRGDARAFVPLGDSVPGVDLSIVDRHLRPVPAGTVGEIYLSSAQIARGYLKRPDLTAASFLPDAKAVDGARGYRTGDLAVRHADGAIEFVGRADTQTKVRGNRVEVEEIEAALRRVPGIHACAVDARPDAGGDVVLTACLVTDDRASRNGAGRRASPSQAPRVEAIRSWLAGRLPHFMIPAEYLLVSSLPHTLTGKLDRRALRALTGTRLEPGERQSASAESRSHTESTLAALWTDVLRRDAIGVRASFFDLGGNSLSAVDLLVRIVERFGVGLELRDLYANPTIAALSVRIGEARLVYAPFAPGTKMRDAGTSGPLSFEQRAAVNLHRGACQNVAITAELNGVVSAPAVQWAVAQLLRRHDILRACLADDTPDAGLRIGDVEAVANPFGVRDLSALPAGRLQAEIARQVNGDVLATFVLTRAPLLRVVLFSWKADRHLLLFVSHRLVCDESSLGILLRDFSRYYFHRVDECALPEPLLFQYPDYAAWQRRAFDAATVDRYVAEWRDALRGLAPVLDLRGGRPRPSVRTYHRARHSFAASADVVHRAWTLAERGRVEISAVLLSVFLLLLTRWSGRDEIPIALPASGRRGRPYAEHLVGPFGRWVRVRARVAPGVRFEELVYYIHKRVLRERDYQEIPLDALLDRLSIDRGSTYTPISQVGFDVATRRPTPKDETSLAVGTVSSEFVMDLDVALVTAVDETALDGHLKYDPDLFDRRVMERMADDYLRLLDAACAGTACAGTAACRDLLTLLD